VITLPDDRLAAFLDAYPYDVHPVSDDAPFLWHFARFGDLLWGDSALLRDSIGPEDGRGERVLLVMLALCVSFSAVFLLLPFVLVRQRWLELPHKRLTVPYFAALGLGFMCFEIVLIQKLTLFLGYPTYTLSVTLFALLLSSGVGSLVAGAYAETLDRALPALLAGLLLMTAFLQFGLDALVAELMGGSLPVRIAASLCVLMPLGLLLGAFMPLGLSLVARLSPHRSEYVAWSWAVNGITSVIGSLLATMLSMTWGFRAVLLLAATLYVVAVLLLRALPRPRGA
jgi:MFS family permease